MILTGAKGVLGSAFCDLYGNELYPIKGRKELNLTLQTEVESFFKKKIFQALYIWLQYPVEWVFLVQNIKHLFLEIIS